jgi:hypothetical protein
MIEVAQSVQIFPHIKSTSPHFDNFVKKRTHYNTIYFCALFMHKSLCVRQSVYDLTTCG